MTLVLQAPAASDPLVPGLVDVIGAVVSLAAVVMMVVALVAWTRNHRSDRSPLLELLMIVLMPVLGPVAYLVALRGVPAKG